MEEQLGARAGDLLGRRRVFISGLAVFSAASLLVGVSPAGWWAISARALQGVGAAIVAPSSLSLLTASFPEGRARSRAVAWYGATAGIGASLGLLIGGALTQWISWRAGFFVNLPTGAPMIVLASCCLPETARPLQLGSAAVVHQSRGPRRHDGQRPPRGVNEWRTRLQPLKAGCEGIRPAAAIATAGTRPQPAASPALSPFPDPRLAGLSPCRRIQCRRPWAS